MLKIIAIKPEATKKKCTKIKKNLDKSGKEI
jgi:hypothetical protein